MTDRKEKLNEMLLGSPEDCFLWHALGLEWVKAGDFPQAIHCFERVLSIDPGYIGSYYHLGKTHEKLGQVSQAVAVYERGIVLASERKDLHARSELQMALEDLID